MSAAPKTADDLLKRLTDREGENLLGRGTRSVAFRPLRWRDSEGTVHACEAVMTMRGSEEIILAWTLCNIDVPNAHYIEDARMTCPVCARALIEART